MTVFPQVVALAKSWDLGLVEEGAGAVRRQLPAVGARHALAPVVDVMRDPRWGGSERPMARAPCSLARWVPPV